MQTPRGLQQQRAKRGGASEADMAHRVVAGDTGRREHEHKRPLSQHCPRVALQMRPGEADWMRKAP
jgi:hypothetical protein